jgi:hypothetical protein
MWATVNTVLDTAFEAWLWPLKSLPAFWQICITAVPITIFALLVFRYASDQQRIVVTKDKIKAHLLEMWLYKDDLKIVLGAQGRVIVNSLMYMRHALVPMAIMIVPLALVIIQLEARYAYDALVPGEQTILAVTLDADAPLSELEATLSLPEGLRQETPPLRIAATRQVLWRVSGESAGQHRIGIHIGELDLYKSIVIGEVDVPPSPATYRGNDLRILAYPLEKPLPSDGFVAAIEVAYARGRSDFAGLSSASWILMGATLILGFALRGTFGVTF